MNKRALSILGIVLILILLVAAITCLPRLFGKKNAPVGLGKQTPLESVQFPNGQKLSLLKLDIGSLTDGNRSPSKSPIRIGSQSSSTWADLAGEIETVESNGAIVARTYQPRDSPSALLILWQADFPLDSTQDAVFTRGRLEKSHRPGASRSGSRAVQGLKKKLSELMLANDPAGPELPQFMVQMQHSTGHWTTAEGPLIANDDHQNLAVTAFSAWEQSAATLILRVLIPGQTPEVISMPNPFQKTSPLPFFPSPLPQNHSEPDFTKTLTKATLLTEQERGQFILLEEEFKGTLSASQNPFHRALREGSSVLENEWGHQTMASFSHFSELGKFESAFPFPPDGNQFRYQTTITRSSFYPRPQKDTVILGEALVQPDGTTLKVTNLKKKTGLKNLTLSALTPENGLLKSTLAAELEWKSDKERDLKMGSGFDASEADLYLFINGATISIGGYDMRRSSKGSSLKSVTGSLQGEWLGQLAAGDTLTIGIAMPLPDQTVEFTFDRSSLSAP